MTVRVMPFAIAAKYGGRSLRSYYVRNRAVIHAALVAAVLCVIAVWRWVFVPVPAGYVGVMWYWRTGTAPDVAAYVEEGTHFVLPWNQMAIYDARVQQLGRDFPVLTRDGLLMTVTANVQFRINRSQVGQLHRSVGPAYVEKLIFPALASYLSETIAGSTTDDAYAARRSELQDVVRDQLATKLAPLVLVDSVLIGAMHFPDAVQAAINRKMEQYQLREEYGYRLEREKLESQRKQVEAEGIARFQRIVGDGISDNYLKWKGIDATLALARSPNAKIVVIGAPKNGMPLILGGEIEQPKVPASPNGAPPQAQPTSAVSDTLPVTSESVESISGEQQRLPK